MVYLGKAKVKDMYIDAKPELFRLASRMRKKPTEAEQVLWKYLRKYRSGGFVFIRQHPIDFLLQIFTAIRLN